MNVFDPNEDIDWAELLGVDPCWYLRLNLDAYEPLEFDDPDWDEPMGLNS